MMTHVDFARWLAWMGKECSNWAGEVLCCHTDELLTPMREDSVRRFLDAMNARLAHITQNTGVEPSDYHGGDDAI